MGAHPRQAMVIYTEVGGWNTGADNVGCSQRGEDLQKFWEWSMMLSPAEYRMKGREGRGQYMQGF